MGLPEELYYKMLEVGWWAKREKIPGPLRHTMRRVAQESLEDWREDLSNMKLFATKMLSGPTNLRVTTAQLDTMTCDACWRLIELLEYIAGIHC